MAITLEEYAKLTPDERIKLDLTTREREALEASVGRIEQSEEDRRLEASKTRREEPKGPADVEIVPRGSITIEDPEEEEDKDGVTAIMKKAGKVRAGEQVDDKRRKELAKERREVTKELAEEQKKTKEKIEAVPITEQERLIAKYEEETRLAKAKMEHKKAMSDLLQSEITTNAKTRYMLDPRNDPMVSFDQRQEIMNSSLRKQYEEGMQRLEAAKPKAPELQDEEIDENQAAITLALQSITGIMGSLSGRDVGLRAAAEAGAVGTEAMVKSVEARQKANAGIMKAHGKSLSKHAEATQKYMTEYLKQVGQNERKGIEEFVKHYKNIEEISLKKRKANLDESKAVIARAKAAGKVSAERAAAAVADIEYETDSITAYEKERSIRDRTSVLAQKANQTAILQALKQSQLKLKTKGIKVKVANTRAALLPQSLSVVNYIEENTKSISGKNAYNRSLSNLRSFSKELGSLNLDYSKSQLMGDEKKMQHSIAIENGLIELMGFINDSGLVPQQFSLKGLSQFVTEYDGETIAVSKVPEMSFRRPDENNPDMELNAAMLLITNKINLLAGNRAGAQESLDVRAGKRLTTKEKILLRGAATGEQPTVTAKKLKRVGEAEELAKEAEKEQGE